MASEDIGLADPRALRLALDAAETYERLGSPEGELALAEAVVYLAMAPKSNAVYSAYNAARAFIKSDRTRPVPLRLRNAPTSLMKGLDYGKGYRYAHDEEGAFAAGERYLPDDMEAQSFYRAGAARSRDLDRRAAYRVAQAQRRGKARILNGAWSCRPAKTERAKARPGSVLRSDCGGRPDVADSPAVLGQCGLPRNSLRSLRLLRSDKRGESEVEARAKRARPHSLRSSAPQSRCARCPAAPLPSSTEFIATHFGSCSACSAKPRAGGRRSDSAAPRSAGLRASARSAPPPLTCRICLSAVNEVNVASYAAGSKTEHRRAVGPAGTDRRSRSGSRPPARGFARSVDDHSASSPQNPRLSRVGDRSNTASGTKKSACSGPSRPLGA